MKRFFLLMVVVASMFLIAASWAQQQNRDQPLPPGAGRPGQGPGPGQQPYIHADEASPSKQVMVPGVDTLMGTPMPASPGAQQPAAAPGQPPAATAPAASPLTVPPAKGKGGGATAAPGTTAAAPASEAKPSEAVPILKGDYQLYVKSGHRDKAWDEFIDPAFTSFDAGNYATAGIFLQRAYEKGCRDALVLFRLGIYRESRGNFKDAAQLFDEAAKDVVTRYPSHPLATEIWRHAGRAHYEAGDTPGALPMLLKALEKSPNDFMLLLMAGQIHRMQKQYAEARVLYDRLLLTPPPEGIKPDPKITILGELTILSYELKDFAGCQAYIDQLLGLSPNDKVGLFYKSQLDKARFKQREQEAIDKMVK